LATLSGVLLGVCQIDLWPLAWVALAPLSLAVAGRRPWPSLALGALAGVLAGAAMYGVLPYGVLTYSMLVAYCGLFMALYGLLVAQGMGRVHPAVDVLLPALAWTGLEYLRRQGTWSFPVNLGASQVALLPLLQVAYLVGGHGVSFLVALPSGVLARWALTGRLPRRAAAAVAVVLAVAVGYGAIRLATPLDERGGPRVAGVQTAFHNWLYTLEVVSPAHRRLLRDSVFTLSERAVAQGSQLVIWPESVLHDHVPDVPELEARIRGLAQRSGATVVAGYYREDDLGLERNSAALYVPGEPPVFYDKRRLAGLAEWRLTAGARNEPLRTPHGRLGVLICLESVYPQDARELVDAGAEMLAVTTNDAGFLRSPMAGFHGHRSVLRAIESDRYLLHLSQAGPSFLFDPHGRARAKAPLFEAGVVAGVMPPRTARSPYHTIGDAFIVLVWAILGAVVLVVPLVRRLRSRTKQRRSMSRRSGGALRRSGVELPEAAGGQ